MRLSDCTKAELMWIIRQMENRPCPCTSEEALKRVAKMRREGERARVKLFDFLRE